MGLYCYRRHKSHYIKRNIPVHLRSTFSLLLSKTGLPISCQQCCLHFCLCQELNPQCILRRGSVQKLLRLPLLSPLTFTSLTLIFFLSNQENPCHSPLDLSLKMPLRTRAVMTYRPGSIHQSNIHQCNNINEIRQCLQLLSDTCATF